MGTILRVMLLVGLLVCLGLVCLLVPYLGLPLLGASLLAILGAGALRLGWSAVYHRRLVVTAKRTLNGALARVIGMLVLLIGIAMLTPLAMIVAKLWGPEGRY